MRATFAFLTMKLNNSVLVLGMGLKIYRSVAKEFKTKVKNFLGIFSTFGNATGVKLVKLLTPSTILNRYNGQVNIAIKKVEKFCNLSNDLKRQKNI